MELYDSQGMVPDIVREVAEPLGVAVNAPGNFYAMVAAKASLRKASRQMKMRNPMSRLTEG